jgi:hypothetical protein
MGLQSLLLKMAVSISTFLSESVNLCSGSRHVGCSILRHWNFRKPFPRVSSSFFRTLLPDLQFILMDSLASSNVEPLALSLSMTPPKFQPAEGLEDIEILPFNIAKFNKAIAERLQATESENVREWIVFSDFNSSKLQLIDKL